MFVYRFLRKLLSRYRFLVVIRENFVINDCCRGVMFFLVIGLVYSGSDFFLLVLEIEDMYSSFYLRFLEIFIIVEVNCNNLGAEGGVGV